MTKPKYEAIMKRLGRMIDSESDDAKKIYDLPEKFAPPLLDLGYIYLHRWSECGCGCLIDCSCFLTTEKGRQEYLKWRTLPGSPKE